MTADPDQVGKATFSDLPEAEAVALAKHMGVHSIPSYNTPLTYPGYRDVDVSYIVCDEDLVIPIQAQEKMIEFLKQDTGKPVDVHHIKASHAPQASQPELVIDIIQQIIEKSN